MTLARDSFHAWVESRRRRLAAVPSKSREADLLLPVVSRPIRLDPKVWAQAALLAAGRLLSNHDRRDETSSRDDNEGVDLLGSAAELLLFSFVQHFGREFDRTAEGETSSVFPGLSRTTLSSGLSYMANAMYVKGGGRGLDGADLCFGVDGGPDAIDAKSYDFAPNHSRFAINANKHRKLGAQRPTYFCLLTPRLGQKGYVALVPYEDVDGWEIEELLARKPEARCLPMVDFGPRYLGLSFQALRRDQPHAYDVQAVLPLVHHGLGDRQDLQGKVPGIEHAYLHPRFDEAVHAVLTGRRFR